MFLQINLKCFYVLLDYINIYFSHNFIFQLQLTYYVILTGQSKHIFFIHEI